MIVALNISALIIVLLIALKSGLIDLKDDRHLVDKGKILALLFTTQFILEVVSTYINRCEFSFERVYDRSLRVAMVGVIGFSIYIDLLNHSATRHKLADLKKNSNMHLVVVIATITVGVLLMQTIGLLFGYDGKCHQKNEKSELL